MNRRWIAAVLVSLASAACADVLILSDGTRLEGELRHVDNGWEVTRADGTIEQVSSQKVVSIQRGPTSTTSPSQVMGRFASLHRSLEVETNPAKAVERLQKFIDQNADPQARAEAQRDLEAWQARVDQKLTRWGKDWITPDERAQRLARAGEVAQSARLLIRDHRLPEAEAALNDVLTGDPQNISALYLTGYLQLRAGKLIDARKNLSALQQIIPDHPPTLYNLGLVLMKQKQWGQSLAQFDQALTAAPGSRFVIDNIAEVLNAVPEDERKSTSYQRLVKRFAAEEATLERELAKQKLYRWGSTWLDQAAHDKVVAAEAEVRKKMADMDTRFKAARSRIGEIDRSIASKEQSMQDIEATSYYRMPDGTLVRRQLPNIYYDLGREIDRLRAERTEVERTVAQLQAEARTVQQDLPQPRYTGNVEPINEDGVPILLPPGAPIPGPTTAPTSNPPATQPGKIEVEISPGRAGG